MQELIDDANAYAEANGLAADLSIDSFADMVTAIEYVQRAQNIAGTTSSEAASTISGSLGMAKASWEDFLTALGNPDADIGAAFGNLAESLGLVAENALPVVGQIFESLGEAIPEAIGRGLSTLVDTVGPALEDALWGLYENTEGPISDLFAVLAEAAGNIGPAIETAMSTVQEFVGGAMEFLQGAFERVRPAIESVIGFLVENAPTFQEIGAKIGEVAEIVGGILANAVNTVADVLAVVVPIVMDVADAVLPALSGALDFVIGFVQFLANVFNGLAGVIEVVISWLEPLYQEVAPYIREVFTELGNVLTELGDGFTQLGQMARNKMEQLQQWLKGMPQRIKSFFSSFATDMGAKFDAAKDRMKNAFQQAKDFIQNIPNQIVGFFGNIAAEVGAKFDAVKEAITSPIESAKNAVSDAIAAIKGFLSQSLPHPTIKLPHFSISGEFDPLNGKLPSLSVSWYARGGIVDGATLIGAGEAGREAIIPLENDAAMQPFAEAVADSLGEYLGDEQLIDWLARNLGPIIEQWTPTMTKREMRRAVAYG